MTERTLPPRWYWYYAAVIGFVAVVGLVLGVVGIYVNNRQDATADATTRHLLACFDRYASESSAASVAVRKATIRKDEATTVLLVRKLLAQTAGADDMKRLADTLAERQDAARELASAQSALDRARKNHPVPVPPSQFCSVQP